MPQWLWWTLLASAILAILFSIFWQIFMKKRIAKIRKESGNVVTQIRPNRGEIRLDVKRVLNNELKDDDIEFMLNTIFVNQYENSLIVGDNQEYISFIIKNQFQWANTWNTNINKNNLTKINEDLNNYVFNTFSIENIENEQLRFNLIFLDNIDTVEKDVESLYKFLAINGMIMANVKGLNNFTRSVIQEKFNHNQYIWEYSTSNNFILIVKKQISNLQIAQANNKEN